MKKEYEPMKPLMKIMNYVLPDCKEVAELVSFSMDETLPLNKRLGLKIHIMFCKFCRRNSEQICLIRKLIRNELRNTSDVARETYSGLSAESRQRISKTIKSPDSDA